MAGFRGRDPYGGLGFGSTRASQLSDLFNQRLRMREQEEAERRQEPIPIVPREFPVPEPQPVPIPDGEKSTMAVTGDINKERSASRRGKLMNAFGNALLIYASQNPAGTAMQLRSQREQLAETRRQTKERQQERKDDREYSKKEYDARYKQEKLDAVEREIRQAERETQRDERNFAQQKEVIEIQRQNNEKQMMNELDKAGVLAVFQDDLALRRDAINHGQSLEYLTAQNDLTVANNAASFYMNNGAQPDVAQSIGQKMAAKARGKDIPLSETESKVATTIHGYTAAQNEMQQAQVLMRYLGTDWQVPLIDPKTGQQKIDPKTKQPAVRDATVEERLKLLSPTGAMKDTLSRVLGAVGAKGAPKPGSEPLDGGQQQALRTKLSEAVGRVRGAFPNESPQQIRDRVLNHPNFAKNLAAITQSDVGRSEAERLLDELLKISSTPSGGFER